MAVLREDERLYNSNNVKTIQLTLNTTRTDKILPRRRAVASHAADKPTRSTKVPAVTRLTQFTKIRKLKFLENDRTAPCTSTSTRPISIEPSLHALLGLVNLVVESHLYYAKFLNAPKLIWVIDAAKMSDSCRLPYATTIFATILQCQLSKANPKTSKSSFHQMTIGLHSYQII